MYSSLVPYFHQESKTMSLLEFILLLFAVLVGSFGGSFLLRNRRKLPPEPRGLPVIGHLHMLGSFPHKTLCVLAKKHGPIMLIRLGSVPTVIVSSPRIAEIVLKTHDHVFAGRPKAQADDILGYGNKSMAFAPDGPYWRNVKKLFVTHLLSSSKIEHFKPIRTQELEATVNLLKKASEKREAVNVCEVVASFMENTVFRMIFGRAQDEDNALKIKDYTDEMTRLAMSFNVSDYFPLLAPLDIQGLARKMKDLHKSMDKVLEMIIKDHEMHRDHQSKEHRDFVDVLLSLLNQPLNPQDKNSEIVGRDHIKAFLQEMVGASFLSSITAVKSIFSLLLKNPRVMLALQDQLRTVVGMHRLVQESDLPKLTYLDNVVKESFRLHPIAPLLFAHESTEDVVVDGFYIPKKTRVMVNIWAIGRDPEIWSENAGEFIPERFTDNDIDLQGQDFRLIPFGSGRRKCPGMPLALINVPLVIAQLAHCFDWKLPDGMTPEEINITDKVGTTEKGEDNLFARPIYRLNY